MHPAPATKCRLYRRRKRVAVIAVFTWLCILPVLIVLFPSRQLPIAILTTTWITIGTFHLVTGRRKKLGILLTAAGAALGAITNHVLSFMIYAMLIAIILSANRA
jgi:branched-subunit amino acid transport protein